MPVYRKAYLYILQLAALVLFIHSLWRKDLLEFFLVCGFQIVLTYLFSPVLGIYICKRLIQLIPLLLIISFFSMFIIDLAPGDFLNQLKGNPQISQETVEQMKVRFGLDKPWYVQYLYWVKNVVTHLNFGESFKYRVPVFELILQRLGNTFILAFCSSVLAWGLAIPLGILSAVRKNTWVDQLNAFIAFFGLSVPRILISLLVLYLCVITDWFPVGSMESALYESMSPWEKFIDVVKHLIPPMFVMGISGMAGLMRQMRSNLLDVLNADYVRTARAKGLSEWIVVLKHALRNAINPMITLFGFTLADLLSTSVIVEIIFGWPGLGNLTWEAIQSQDLYLVLATLVMSSVMLVFGNLAADILLRMADPRIA